LIQDFHAFGGSRDIFNQFVELIGVEKTFFNNRASLTVRVPVSTLRAQPTPSESFALFNQGTGVSTVVGDASIVLKVILFDNTVRGNTIGAGVAASAPTTQTPFLGGSGTIINVVRDTPDWVIEPYIGAIFRRGEFTFQTVTGAGLPTSANHAIYVYTTGSAAWMFYRAAHRNQFVTAMSAIAELSVLEPVGPLRGIIGASQHTADFISVTIGNSIILRDWIYFTYGVNTPLTHDNNPNTTFHKPYSTQVVSSLSIRY